MVLSGTYRRRNPEQSSFYQCLESYWEEFQESYPYFYEKDYGPLRAVVERTVTRFLECGIFRHGFARVRCAHCQHEYLLAFSCKTRYFCPSCQAKRVAAFVQWVNEEILEPVDHRQYVWTIPRVLRPSFRRDRRLLGELARCAWKTLQEYCTACLGRKACVGAIVAIQTYGDQLNWHPHLHSIVSDVAWDSGDHPPPLGSPDPKILTGLFRHHVLKMLQDQRRLSREFARRLRSWEPSGFQVFCGRPVAREETAALERLTSYILRPSFAGTRVQFDPQEGQITYHTSKGIRRHMDALDWIALVTSHIPDVHEQMVRYYGRYSNASRGKRKKAKRQRLSQPSVASSSAESDSQADRFSRERRRSWARLLKKIYEIDPLRCPQCGHAMQIIAFIEQPAVIRKILRHLQLWQRPPRSPPPPLFPLKLETFLASLTPRQAQQIRASTDSIFWDDVPVFRD